MKIKKTKTIRVCDYCETPLIWTFAFDYCERYCINCGAKGGMMGTGKDVPATRDLIFKKRLVDAVWGAIYCQKGLRPVSSQRIGCDKCSGSEPHSHHMSPDEREWNRIAREWLIRLQGAFKSEEI